MKLSPIYTIATTAELHPAIIAINGVGYRFEGPSDAFKVIGRARRTLQIQLEDASFGSIAEDYTNRFKDRQTIVKGPRMFLICYAEEKGLRTNISQLDKDIADISGFLGRTGFIAHCYKHEEESIPAQEKARRSSSESRTA